MNYNETLQYIHSLGNFSLPAGLERIKEVLSKLGNPQNSFKSIHIAGTNGKGSVTTMVSSVFMKAGYKTGTFISPFIIDFRERIQINGEYIFQEDLVTYAERIKKTETKLTEFEFVTALAFLYFREKEIDVLVCETGLGGRFDATNTLENLYCTVITKIGLDHTAVLGESIEKITEEKCGILRKCPAVTSPLQEKGALAVIKNRAENLIVPDFKEVVIKQTDISGSTFIYKGDEFRINLGGEYQIENALVSLETIYNSGCNIPYNIIYKGLESAEFPARLEVISKKPLIILDGAHNPDGAKVLSEELKKYDGKVIAIIGMMKDKNVDDVLKETLRYCALAVAVTVPDMPRSMSAQELKNKAEKYCNCVKAEDLSKAINIAIKENDNAPIFVFGSLYLASQIRPFLKKKVI